MRWSQAVIDPAPHRIAHMRLSTDPTDPGHWTRGLGVARVYLGGTEITHVLTADEERRMVIQCDLDDDGNLQIDGRGTSDPRVRKITRYGHVRIEPSPHLARYLEATRSTPSYRDTGPVPGGQAGQSSSTPGASVPAEARPAITTQRSAAGR